MTLDLTVRLDVPAATDPEALAELLADLIRDYLTDGAAVVAVLVHEETTR